MSEINCRKWRVTLKSGKQQSSRIYKADTDADVFNDFDVLMNNIVDNPASKYVMHFDTFGGKVMIPSDSIESVEYLEWAAGEDEDE